MAQRPTRGNAPVQKQPTVPQEEDAAQKSQEKPQDQGTIAVVKSKIREKDAAQQEDEPLASTKVTSSKMSTRPKGLKRGASSENILKEDAATMKKSEIKLEKVEPKAAEDQAKLEAVSKAETGLMSEQDQGSLAESKSKKSVMKLLPSKNSLGGREDDQTENLPVAKSEIKKDKEASIPTDPALSGTGPPESQEQKSDKSDTQTMKNMQTDLSAPKKVSPKPLAQKNPAERKNYLVNLFPEPLDEYPADEEEPKDQERQNKKND